MQYEYCKKTVFSIIACTVMIAVFVGSCVTSETQKEHDQLVKERNQARSALAMERSKLDPDDAMIADLARQLEESKVKMAEVEDKMELERAASLESAGTLTGGISSLMGGAGIFGLPGAGLIAIIGRAVAAGLGGLAAKKREGVA